MFSKYTIASICILLTLTLVKTENLLDPQNKEDQVFLLADHFSKLNTILNATESLAQGLANLYQRHDAILNKTENLQQSLLNLTQSQKDLENRLKTTLDNVYANLSKRQENLIASQSQTWQTILRRQDGSVDFNRNWTEYQNGFGDSSREFFIGLEKLHEMTTYGRTQELLVVLKDFEGETRYAKYDSFRVGNAKEKYALVEVGKYSGDAGDSLIEHKGYKFSTPDQDNDVYDDGHCAKSFQSGWWFYKCYMCNLNGFNWNETEWKNNGVEWRDWKADHSLKFAEMKIRSRI